MTLETMTTETAEVRCCYLDSLRVFAAFAVMVLHVASQYEYTTDVHSFDWLAMNFWDSLVRWPVSVFVMISGALFLSRDIPAKKLYTKYIFRIFTAFVFWSLVYACRAYVKNGDALKAFAQFLTGYYHMWFLWMIAGLYAVVPFMRKIAESGTLTKYFLVMSFVFAFVLPETVEIISLFSEEYGKFAGKLAGMPMLEFVGGFTGYFLLGYFLSTAKISRRAERVIYAAGVVSVIVCVILSSAVSLAQDSPSSIFYGNLTVTTLCEAVAVFVFFREKLNFPVRFIRQLSQYSFGAYLVHAAVINLLGKMGLHSLTFCPVISIPVIAAIVFVISFTISAILNHIPVLKKYIV
ncbi:MAG: acyltransferase family protein [Synergistaceae bacterium]|nr:acyltransferase family protein [Synergistaceae bacterium]